MAFKLGLRTSSNSFGPVVGISVVCCATVVYWASMTQIDITEINFLLDLFLGILFVAVIVKMESSPFVIYLKIFFILNLMATLAQRVQKVVGGFAKETSTDEVIGSAIDLYAYVMFFLIFNQYFFGDLLRV